MIWDDLAARARGLGVHLLEPAALDALARAERVGDIVEVLEAHHVPVERGATALDVERALRRVAAADFAVLARWAGPRLPILAVLFEDEDRRSLRALVRGVAAGAPADQRLGGLLPTPALPEAALRELAGQRSIATIAALLAVWQSPWAEVLGEHATAVLPDLLALERALDRTFAARAAAGARRGDEALARHVSTTIDVENTFAALAIAAEPADLDPGALFVAGGRQLSRGRFVEAAHAGARAGGLLAAAFPGSGLGDALATGTLEELEAAALADAIAAQHRIARLHPTGLAPVVLLVLRRRAEARAVREASWRASFARAPEAA